MKNCTFPVRSGRGKCYLCKDLFSNNPQRFYFIMKKNYSAARQSAACSVRFLTKGKKTLHC